MCVCGLLCVCIHVAEVHINDMHTLYVYIHDMYTYIYVVTLLAGIEELVSERVAEVCIVCMYVCMWVYDNSP